MNDRPAGRRDRGANAHGTHSLRPTKATMINQRAKNLRCTQLLLGDTKLESPVRYFGIEVEDAPGDFGQDQSVAEPRDGATRTWPRCPLSTGHAALQ